MFKTDAEKEKLGIERLFVKTKRFCQKISSGENLWNSRNIELENWEILLAGEIGKRWIFHLPETLEKTLVSSGTHGKIQNGGFFWPKSVKKWPFLPKIQFFEGFWPITSIFVISFGWKLPKVFFYVSTSVCE